MAAPELEPASARDPLIPLIVERLYHRTAYRARIFDITLGQGIPCFWVAAVDESPADDRPRVLCAAGSAIDAERAVVNALQELATIVEWRLATYAGERERAAAMVENPALVRTMHDHALVNAHPRAVHRLDFLLAGRERTTFDARRHVWAWPPHDDVCELLREIVGRYLPAGLDVLVVDQTTPEHEAGGFACVKTIVPGTLPMTFGHHARRVDGLPRLLKVPHRLGRRERPLTTADINPHPHPFP
jgi:ribosomal protein S12 methylthiotransferase accessory factor